MSHMNLEPRLIYVRVAEAQKKQNTLRPYRLENS